MKGDLIMGYYDYYSSNPSYYDYYDYGYTVSDPYVFTVLGTIFGAFLGIVIVISLVIGILQIIGTWKVFTKAGEKGWKCLIPIYNVVILFKISGLSPWIIFGYLAGIIPFVGWIVCLGITIYQCNSLAKSFGKDVGYTIGLLFLPTIFYMILGFGNAQYIGKRTFSSASTYQGDGIVNIYEKTQDEPPTNNDEDNANL